MLTQTHCRLLVAGLGLIAGTAAASPPQLESGGASPPEVTLHEQVNQSLGLTAHRLVTLDVPDTPGVALTTTFTIDGAIHTLDLVPHTIRAADYQRLVQTEDGSLVADEPGPERTLRGTVRGVPGSRVAGSLLGDGLHAMIDMGAGPRQWIEPMAGAVAGADATAYVLYSDEDVRSAGGCGNNDHDLVAGFEPQGAGGVAGAGECFFVTELACDSDYEYYLDYNQNADDVEAQITSIINTMNLQYESQVQITHEITALLVRPFPDDPYNSQNPSTLLGQFRSYWLTTLPGISRDVAQLFTGRDLSGNVIGIAYTLGGICTDNGYCVSQNISGFGCRTDLSAHELGHLWNAGHCSCSNPAFTMNPSLTCANVFSQATINSISFHRDNRECLSNPCIPDNDYCSNLQLTSSGETLFSTSGASTDGPGGLLCDAFGMGTDVWYLWTAECDGQATVDLCGSSFDSAVAIYPQVICPTSALQAIACSDDEGCGDQASVSFDVSGGESYVIQVGSATGDAGDGIMTITPPDCSVFPSNDDCGTPRELLEGETSFSTNFATTDGPPESCESGAIENDIWFRFNSLCDDLVTVSLCGADFDTRLAVYDSTCPAQSDTAIACSDDSACGAASEVQFVATSGDVYRIRIGGAAGQSGTGMMNVTCGAAAPCPSDNTGDGQVNVDDLVNLVAAWGVCPGCAADSNNSGEVDVDDLIDLIASWGPCP